MSLIKLNIIALVPTRAGCATFLGNDDKVIQFYIEHGIGQSINDQLAGESFDRPMTYDLMSNLLKSFGAGMKSLLIHGYQEGEDSEGIFYAKMVWEMSNELESRKIVDIDCRPSDGMALAVRQNVDVMMCSSVWEGLEDQSELLAKLKEQMGDIR